MATVRALKEMKQEREEDHFPVMRVYTQFVRELTRLLQQYDATGATRRRVKFLRNYFRAFGLPELQAWKDTMFRCCVDIVKSKADGSPYLRDTVVSTRLQALAPAFDLSAGMIPSYLFPTTKPYLRMDMAKALQDLDAALKSPSCPPHAVPLPPTAKRSAALCSTLDGLIKILQSRKVAIAGKRFDGRTGKVVTVTFFDDQQERRKVEPHLTAFREEAGAEAGGGGGGGGAGGGLSVAAGSSFSAETSDSFSAVDRLGSAQALSAVVDAVIQIWKLRDEDSTGAIAAAGSSPRVQAAATAPEASDRGAGADSSSANIPQTKSDDIPPVHVSNSLRALREHLSPSDFGWAFSDSNRERFDDLTRELEATASEKLLLVHAASLSRRHEFSLVHLDSTIAAVQRYLAVSNVPTGTGARGSSDTEGTGLRGVPGLLRRLERRRMHWAWLLSFTRQALSGMCELDRSALENCLREHESWQNIQEAEDRAGSPVDPSLKVGKSFVADTIERIRMVLWIVDVVGLGEVRRDWLVVRRGLQLLFAFQLHALSAAQHIFRRSDALDEEPLARLASFVRSPSRSDAQADACQTAFSNFHAFLKNYSKPAEVSKADGEAEGLVMNRLVATLHRHLRACAAAAKRNDSGQTTTPSPILEWDELQVEAIGVELEAAMRNEKPSPGTPAESDDPSAHSKESTVSPKSGQTNSGATNNNHSNSNSNSSNNNNESFEKFLSAVTQVSESGDDGGFAAMSASATNGAEEEDGGRTFGDWQTLMKGQLASPVSVEQNFGDSSASSDAGDGHNEDDGDSSDLDEFADEVGTPASSPESMAESNKDDVDETSGDDVDAASPPLEDNIPTDSDNDHDGHDDDDDDDDGDDHDGDHDDNNGDVMTADHIATVQEKSGGVSDDYDSSDDDFDDAFLPVAAPDGPVHGVDVREGGHVPCVVTLGDASSSTAVRKNIAVAPAAFGSYDTLLNAVLERCHVRRDDRSKFDALWQPHPSSAELVPAAGALKLIQQHVRNSAEGGSSPSELLHLFIVSKEPTAAPKKAPTKSKTQSSSLKQPAGQLAPRGKLVSASDGGGATSTRSRKSEGNPSVTSSGFSINGRALNS